MNEVELNEMLGSELFDRLSQDDKELLLNTAGKFDFNIEGEIPNKPICPQPFYVIDKELGEVATHPSSMDEIEELQAVAPNGTHFAIDCYGQLLILDGLGNWMFAPEKYIYVFNSDYWT